MSYQVKLTSDNLFKDLAFDIKRSLMTADARKNIVDFVNTEIDQEAWGARLYPQQWAILKTFYNEPLTEEEESIIESWVAQGRCTRKSGKVPYQALVLECGRRAGKTLLASIIGTYEFYKLCILPNPHKHYNLASNSPIAGLVLATTASQSERTIYGQIAALIPNVYFFRTLIERKELVIQTERVMYKEKNCFLYSGNSSSGAQVGSALLFLIMDEVARFDDPGSDVTQGTALELWDNLGASGVSFGTDAKRVAISSAWFQGDAIEKLYNDSKLEESWLGFQLRTWDVNKAVSRDTPVIRSAYITNPVRAALEYEGIRTAKAHTFFDPVKVKQAMRGHSVIKTSAPIYAGDGLVYLELEEIEPSLGQITVMHLDPAVTNDGYGLAFGHAELTADHQLLVIIDGIVLWQPTDTHSVCIANVNNTIAQIHLKRPISYLSADQHNSAETIQRFAAHGIKTEIVHSTNVLQLNQYHLMRSLMQEGRLVLPRDSQFSTRMYDEFCRITAPNSERIQHPKDGSKDITDAIAGVCWRLCNGQGLVLAGTSSSTLRSFKLRRPREFRNLT